MSSEYMAATEADGRAGLLKNTSILEPETTARDTSVGALGICLGVAEIGSLATLPPIVLAPKTRTWYGTPIVSCEIGRAHV